MGKLIVAGIVSLLTFVLSVQPSQAADESIPCIPEPTNMAIAYGSVVACSIGPTGSDSDIFKFSGSANQKVAVLISRRSGTFQPCIELTDPNGVPVTHKVVGVTFLMQITFMPLYLNPGLTQSEPRIVPSMKLVPTP